MSLRQSARLRGLEPSSDISQTIGIKRTRETEDSPNSAMDTFSFVRNKKRNIASDPVIGTQKIAAIAPQAITDTEEVKNFI